MENGINTKKIESFGVLICAFNEEKHIEQVVRTTWDQKPDHVVVVDDSSFDATVTLAEGAGAKVLRSSENKGKGEGLRRGFKYLRELGCDAVIVLDGDGQHDPSEIGRFLDAYNRTQIPILVGNRMAVPLDMSLLRRRVNILMSWILNRLVKVYVADPTCGFRFYRSDVLPFIMSDLPRCAFEFDILVHAAIRHVRIDTVRVSTIYTRKRRNYIVPVRNAWWILRIVRHHFSYNVREGKVWKI